MGVNITTIAYLRVSIIGIGSTSILMVVEDQGIYIYTHMKIDMEHNHGGLEDDFPFQLGDL